MGGGEKSPCSEVQKDQEKLLEPWRGGGISTPAGGGAKSSLESAGICKRSATLASFRGRGGGRTCLLRRQPLPLQALPAPTASILPRAARRSAAASDTRAAPSAARCAFLPRERAARLPRSSSSSSSLAGPSPGPRGRGLPAKPRPSPLRRRLRPPSALPGRSRTGAASQDRRGAGPRPARCLPARSRGRLAWVARADTACGAAAHSAGGALSGCPQRPWRGWFGAPREGPPSPAPPPRLRGPAS